MMVTNPKGRVEAAIEKLRLQSIELREQGEAIVRKIETLGALEDREATPEKVREILGETRRKTLLELADESRLSVDDCLNEPPERDWFLSRLGSQYKDRTGVITAGTAGIFASAGGLGKSWAMLQLAIATVTADDSVSASWLGYTVERPGRALVAMAEEDRDELLRRVHACIHAASQGDEARRRAIAAKVAERLTLLPLRGTRCRLLNKEGERTEMEDGLKQVLAARGPWSLVVIDSLSRFASPDAEKDNEAAADFVGIVEQFGAKAYGSPCVILVAHVTKSARETAGDANAVRGAGAITDNSRFVMTLAKAVDGDASKKSDDDQTPEEAEANDVAKKFGLLGADVLKLTPAKSNYAEGVPPPHYLKREPNGTFTYLDPDVIHTVQQARKRANVASAYEAREDAKAIGKNVRARRGDNKAKAPKVAPLSADEAGKLTS